jgi:hypothetical protein
MGEALNILELQDRQGIIITPIKYEIFEYTIFPKYLQGQSKKIKILRIYVPKEEQLFGPGYWDITSQTLIATLLPILKQKTLGSFKVQIVAIGVAPAKRFSVTVIE